MSQDPNGNRVAAITGGEAKTPVERAEQIRKMQEAAALTPVQTHAPEAAPSAGKTSSGSNQPVALFDVNPVANVNMLTGPSAAGADQAAYSAKQAETAALFGTKGADIEVTGVPWKIIPFGPSSVMELKKPDSEYNVTVPPQAVVTKQGKLFEMTVSPKVPGSEPVQKRALLVGEVEKEGTPKGAKPEMRPALKGADWRTPAALKKGADSIPDFALSLFRSIFKDNTIQPHELKDYQLTHVAVGKKACFECTAQRKSQVDGKLKTESTTLNNFGLKVPEANDRQRHDINVALYYLDHFQAG